MTPGIVKTIRRGVLPQLLSALIIVTVFTANGVAQDTSRAEPGEMKKPETEVTLFPVPDFTSGIWKRAKLTGDWGGLRSKMTNNGVQLDMDTVHMFQNVTRGGIDTTGRYVGTAEIVLHLKRGSIPTPGRYCL